MPPYDGRRNLVAYRCKQQRRVPGERTRLLADEPEDLAAQTPIVEERNVLRPGETGKYPQTVLRGCIEHVARRQRIGSYGIDGGVRHHGEITPDLRRFRKQMSILARRERAVRDPTHQKRLAVYA